MLHYGSSTYPAHQARVEAVARRARRIPTEYASKAKQVDTKYCGTAPGETGPVARKLQSFDPVMGLVFGSWGEASPDVERLLSWLAREGAGKLWRDMGCQDPVAAQGILAWSIRRRWAMAALRENARLKIDRLTYVGRGASIAAQRRATSQATWSARTEARAMSSTAASAFQWSLRR